MKMLTVSLLVCALMALAAASDVTQPEPILQGLCPDNFFYYNGRCFRFFPDLLPWAEAEENCMNMSANLASVHSRDEDVFIYSMIKERDASNPESWIGGSDCQQDNVWLWSNGKKFVHTNWGTTILPGYKHGCIVVNDGAKFRWDARECSELRPYVCAFTM
ncbi:ladderlectin-like [Clinocottus analis]|uniref:ladderlectin-like n=1 Tax=Clinocottus analis TaxID=304258 RepID=UPI0035BF09E9